MKRLLLITTRRRFRQTSAHPTDLYFEPLFFEDVMNVIEQEKPIGVIVQFGGQTAINLGSAAYQSRCSHSWFKPGKH